MISYRSWWTRGWRRPASSLHSSRRPGTWWPSRPWSVDSQEGREWLGPVRYSPSTRDRIWLDWEVVTSVPDQQYLHWFQYFYTNKKQSYFAQSCSSNQNNLIWSRVQWFRIYYDCILETRISSLGASLVIKSCLDTERHQHWQPICVNITTYYKILHVGIDSVTNKYAVIRCLLVWAYSFGSHKYWAG